MGEVIERACRPIDLGTRESGGIRGNPGESGKPATPAWGHGDAVMQGLSAACHLAVHDACLDGHHFREVLHDGVPLGRVAEGLGRVLAARLISESENLGIREACHPSLGLR